MPSAMTLSAATAAAVARSLNAAEAARRPGGLRERLVEARDGKTSRMLAFVETGRALLQSSFNSQFARACEKSDTGGC